MTEKSIGGSIRLTGTFTDIDGDAADPTTVTFTIKEPDETITTYVHTEDAELVKSATGIYYVDWPITQEGVHNYEFDGTTGVDAAFEGSFRVRRRAVAA